MVVSKARIGVFKSLIFRWTMLIFWGGTLRESNIAMKNNRFEDVFPIKHGDIPASYVSVLEGNFLGCN